MTQIPQKYNKRKNEPFRAEKVKSSFKRGSKNTIKIKSLCDFSIVETFFVAIFIRNTI